MLVKTPTYVLIFFIWVLQILKFSAITYYDIYTENNHIPDEEQILSKIRINALFLLFVWTILWNTTRSIAYSGRKRRQMLSSVYKRIHELKRGRLLWKQLNLLVELIELKIYKYDNWQLVMSSSRLTCCWRLRDCLNALWNGICISRDWCEVETGGVRIFDFGFHGSDLYLYRVLFLIKSTNWSRKKIRGKFYRLLSYLLVSYWRVKWLVYVN
jgi:hypothetical protein